MVIERRGYARFGSLRSRGTATIGNGTLCFHGRFVLCIPFEAVLKSGVRGRDLAVSIEQGTAYFELGQDAQMWLDGIAAGRAAPPNPHRPKVRKAP